MYKRNEHVQRWKCENPNNRRGWLVDAFKVPFNMLDYIFNPCEYGEAGCLPAYTCACVLIDVVAVWLYMLNVVACYRC